MVQSRKKTLSAVAPAEMWGELHSPSSQGEYFPGELDEQIGKYGFILGDNGDWYAMDRLMIVRLLMVAIVAVFLVIVMHRPKLVPTGLQNVAELMLDLVRIHITEEILGKKERRHPLLVLATIFFLIISMNTTAIIPDLNILPNARTGIPLVSAPSVYVTLIYAGSKKMGFFKFVKLAVVTPSLPPVLYLIMVLTEIFSDPVLRPATLIIRLMANMLADHTVLVLLFDATNLLFRQLNGRTASPGLTLVAAAVFTLFEMLVIFLQVYIFTLLSAAYIELPPRADER